MYKSTGLTPKRLRAKELKCFYAIVIRFLVAGGFGNRGVEGKIQAIRYARENRIPYLGICLGMQLSIVEYARNVFRI